MKRFVIVGCDSVVSFVATSGTDGNDGSLEVVAAAATMSFVSTVHSLSLEILPLGFHWRFQAKALH